ncbi:tRNA(Met) cytidine acetyltransferase TmcA [Kaarinaea lacus]
MNEIIGQFETLLDRARSAFHRECIVLTGDQNWCLTTAELLSQALDLSHSIVVSESELNISMATTVATDKAINFLGHEFNHAIINCHDGIDPNVLGAISGTVRGGGLFILLVPALEKLSKFDDPEKNRMTIWPYEAKDIHNRFLSRFESILKQSPAISVFSKKSIRISEPAIAKTTFRDDYLKNERCATVEQRQTVESILHVVDGHRRRPLVITADRGRGKSSALGIAAADLLKRGNHNIIATGPRFSATEKIFEHAAAQVLGTVKNNEIIYKDSLIRFMPVDALIKENPDCNLLIIDEAAAIPVNLLTKLLTHYSRIVFSTTTYGYEGTGRGFNLRFFEILNKTVPGWKHQEIKTPIRWAPHDPVEECTSELLCLNAELPKIPADIDYSGIVISTIDRSELAINQQQLSDIFSLLVLAHYKTQPRDLRYLLDSKDLTVFVAQYKGVTLGAIIVELEGGLDDEISDKIYKNERRVHGHLLPQSIESTVGIKEASRLRYLRVIRIITHPSSQRHGVGSKMLAFAEEFAAKNHIDLVGANFGINNDVLPFWDASGYFPVHVGLTANTNTGTHSIGVLKPLSQAGKELFEQATILFYSKFGFMLTTAYNNLDASLVEYLFSLAISNHSLPLDEQTLKEISRFAHSNSDYDMAAKSLNKFAYASFFNENTRSALNDIEKGLLIKKVLQQHSWPSVISDLKLEGKSQATQLLREVIAKLEKSIH